MAREVAMELSETTITRAIASAHPECLLRLEDVQVAVVGGGPFGGMLLSGERAAQLAAGILEGPSP